MRTHEFESWKAFFYYLETRPDCFEAWFDGFESGVDDPRYSIDDDGLTDQPWCAPWDWDAWSDEFDFRGDQLDGFGRPTEEAVYDFAKTYAASLRPDIVELLDEDEAFKNEEAQEA